MSEEMTKSPTLAQAKIIVRPLGFSVNKHNGEYRLAPLEGTRTQREDRAHYSTDLEDAIAVANTENARSGFCIADLSPMQTRALAALVASDCANAYFRNAARDAELAGAFAACQTLGEFAIAFLQHRIGHLQSL